MPLVVFDEETIMPAASLWTGTRAWTHAFRDAGLGPGDRLVLALPPSPAFLQILFAALWNRLTLALLPPGSDGPAVTKTLDARALIASDEAKAAWTASPAGAPIRKSPPLRASAAPPTPDARLLLRTSGTTGSGPRGHGRWVALSDQNLWAVLQSHRPALNRSGACVLSMLPWHHAFGLIIDLLPALLDGATIVREPSSGRSVSSIVATARQWSVTHSSMVPLTAARLANAPGGQAFLGGLQGGVVGGAAVPPALAEVLASTRLRAGYGQTEAAPGIALGAPGDWQPHYLGAPLGCEVRLDDRDELQFRGPNACLGIWKNGHLHRLPPNRWVATGDLVRPRPPSARPSRGLVFCGRTDDVFKLANGRAVSAAEWEVRVCTQFPAIQHLMLWPTPGGQLGLALTAVPAPSPSALKAALGGLGSHLSVVHTLPASAWRITPKGDVDRPHMTRLLAEVAESGPSESVVAGAQEAHGPMAK